MNQPKKRNTSRRNATRKKLLTEMELELMNILWDLQEGTVRDVLERLPRERDLAYTTVATTIRILEDKKVVTSRKQGKAHIFTPILLKESYEARSLNHMVKKVFNNAPVSIVARLINEQNISKEELEEMKKLLEERLK